MDSGHKGRSLGHRGREEGRVFIVVLLPSGFRCVTPGFPGLTRNDSKFLGYWDVPVTDRSRNYLSVCHTRNHLKNGHRLRCPNGPRSGGTYGRCGVGSLDCLGPRRSWRPSGCPVSVPSTQESEPLWEDRAGVLPGVGELFLLRKGPGPFPWSVHPWHLPTPLGEGLRGPQFQSSRTSDRVPGSVPDVVPPVPRTLVPEHRPRSESLSRSARRLTPVSGTLS